VRAPGIGFSIGEDRLVMTVDQTGDAGLAIFVAPLGDAALAHAGTLARDLRREGKSVEVMAGGSSSAPWSWRTSYAPATL